MNEALPLFGEGAAGDCACPVSIRELPLLVIDLETSGGVPLARWNAQGSFREAAEITEVGLVRMCGPVVLDSFESLCAIQGGIPGRIQAITGITPAMLVDAPSWETVALRLAPLLEGRIWVAHNAAFDGAFLHAFLPEGLRRRHRLLCTLRLARALVPESPGHSLSALCECLEIPRRTAHRALADAEATAVLLGLLMERAEARGMDAQAFLKLGAVPWPGEKRATPGPGKRQP